MEVRLYKPRSDLLNEFAECIYTLKRVADEKSVTYMSYPSVFAMICLNANASIVSSSNNLTVLHTPNKAVESNLLVNFDSPGLVRYERAADEIVVYFKPLGLNACLDQDLRRYVRKPFIPFALFDDYQESITKIFALKKDRERIFALEYYWLAKFRGFRHQYEF